MKAVAEKSNLTKYIKLSKHVNFYCNFTDSDTSGSEVPDKNPEEENKQTYKNTLMMFPGQRFRSVIEVVTATKINTSTNDRIDENPPFLTSSTVIQRRIYSPHLLTKRNRIERKGIDIASTNDSLIVGFSSFPRCCLTDAFNGISVDNLGKDYMGVTLSTDTNKIRNGMKYLAVVAAYNNTRISFRLNTTSGKAWKNITLNRLETYQLSRGFDLTGSRVKGDKPFAFFSGDECAFFGGGGCSHTIENLPKVSDLGKTYIIPPFHNVSQTFYRIVPTTHVTSVIIKTGLETQRSLEISDNFIENHDTSLSAATFIQTSEPVLVSVYITFNNQFVSMTIIPPVCQFSNDFVLVTPSFKAFENYCVVIIEANFANELYIDQSRLNEIVLMKYSTVSMEDERRWVTMSFLLPGGASNIYHPNKSVRFGLIQYGVDLESKKDNYAFPSSFRFDSASCK